MKKYKSSVSTGPDQFNGYYLKKLISTKRFRRFDLLKRLVQKFWLGIGINEQTQQLFTALKIIAPVKPGRPNEFRTISIGTFFRSFTEKLLTHFRKNEMVNKIQDICVGLNDKNPCGAIGHTINLFKKSLNGNNYQYIKFDVKNAYPSCDKGLICKIINQYDPFMYNYTLLSLNCHTLNTINGNYNFYQQNGLGQGIILSSYYCSMLLHYIFSKFDKSAFEILLLVLMIDDGSVICQKGQAADQL